MNANADNNEASTLCCASCGIAENDDVKLKNCTACYLVRYCSVKCQKDHRKQHKRDCRKRAAELHDELLFKQPESTHLGDCPICCLPLPLGSMKSGMMNCCSKVICAGCAYANMRREMEMRLKQTCLFCREAPHNSEEEHDQRRMKRIEANDPVAMVELAINEFNKSNHSSAVEWFNKAAELGYAEAHYKLSSLYQDGHAVEKDEGKALYHLEEAAIGGHPKARHNLGYLEGRNGNTERAVKHWIIAAKQGDDNSMKALMEAFKGGVRQQRGTCYFFACTPGNCGLYQESTEGSRRRISSREGTKFVKI